MKKILTLITAALLILNISLPVFAEISEGKPSDNLTYMSYIQNDEVLNGRINLYGNEIADWFNNERAYVRGAFYNYTTENFRLKNALVRRSMPLTPEDAEICFSSSENFLKQYNKIRQKEANFDVSYDNKNFLSINCFYDNDQRSLGYSNGTFSHLYDKDIKDFVDRNDVIIKKDSKVYYVSSNGLGEYYVIMSDKIDYVISRYDIRFMPWIARSSGDVITYEHDIKKIAKFNTYVDIYDGWLVMSPDQAIEAIKISHSSSEFEESRHIKAYKEAYGIDLAAEAVEKDSKVN